MPSIQDIHQHIDSILSQCDEKGSRVQMQNPNGDKVQFISHELEDNELVIHFRSEDWDVFELYITELSAPQNVIEPGALRIRDMNDEPFDLYC